MRRRSAPVLRHLHRLLWSRPGRHRPDQEAPRLLATGAELNVRAQRMDGIGQAGRFYSQASRPFPLMYQDSGHDAGVELGQGDELYIAGLLRPLLELVGEPAGRQVEKARAALRAKGVTRPALAGA